MKGKPREYVSRKFVLALLCLVGGFSLAWFGKDLAAFTGLVAAVLGFYNGANVAQDYFASRNQGVKTNGNHT